MLFFKKDSGFMLKINKSADNPSPWKIPFLYSIRFDLKDTFSLLMCVYSP